MTYPYAGDHRADLNEMIYLDKQSFEVKYRYCEQFEFSIHEKGVNECSILVNGPSSVTTIEYEVAARGGREFEQS